LFRERETEGGQTPAPIPVVMLMEGGIGNIAEGHEIEFESVKWQQGKEIMVSKAHNITLNMCVRIEDFLGKLDQYCPAFLGSNCTTQEPSNRRV
jgi:hypothetical protein